MSFTIFKHKIQLHYCHTRSLCVYFYLICAENKSLSTLKDNKSKGWFIYLEESSHLMTKDSLAKRQVDERYFIWKSDSFFLDQAAATWSLFLLAHASILTGWHYQSIECAFHIFQAQHIASFLWQKIFMCSFFVLIKAFKSTCFSITA